MTRVWRIMVRGVGGGVVGLAAVVAALILSQWPVDDPRAAPGQGLRFARETARSEPAPLREYTARDGTTLGYRAYEAGRSDAPLMVMVHGSGWHGLQFDALAARVADAGLADVVVPDLRGHGPDPVRRGDIDHIGQLETDLADLIAHRRAADQPVVMLGHSSGGGLTVRFAGGPHGAVLDGAVLMAPYLGHDAPTTRANSGGWARPMVRRIIGLSILDRLGITALHHLSVIQFRFPDAVLDGPRGDTATRAYSYRLNRSYAPRGDLSADLAGLPDHLLIAGRADEAFVATRFESTITDAAASRGRYVLLDGVGHLGVVDAPGSFAALSDWLSGRY